MVPTITDQAHQSAVVLFLTEKINQHKADDDQSQHSDYKKKEYTKRVVGGVDYDGRIDTSDLSDNESEYESDHLDDPKVLLYPAVAKVLLRFFFTSFMFFKTSRILVHNVAMVQYL